MKAIKAYVQRGCVDSVIRTLKSAGFFNIRVAHMSRIPDASGTSREEQCFSVGEKMTSEVSLELVCEDRRFEEAVTIIFDNGQSCDPEPGWIYVSTVDMEIRIRRKPTLEGLQARGMMVRQPREQEQHARGTTDDRRIRYGDRALVHGHFFGSLS